MIRKIFLALLASAGLVSIAAAAADPTMHQVYEAARAGRMTEAQGMMDQVLRDHPNSAKAHFVEAELLAKQGRMANAASELANAERLAPGLPFAKPEAVSNLRARISGSPLSSAVRPAATGTPWGLVLIGLGLIAAIVFFARSMARRNVAYIPAGTYPGGPMQAYGPGGAPMGPIGPIGPAGPAGGIGSGIMGGLATGAALGAGMVAGEALMHHFTDGNRPSPGAAPFADSWDAAPNDMGGADFGVADSGSWDDGSGGGGGDDWS